MSLKCLKVVVATFLFLSIVLPTPAAGDTVEQQRIEAVDKGVKHLVAALDNRSLGGRYHGYIRCNDHALLGLSLLCHGSGYEDGPYRDRHDKLLAYFKQHRFSGTTNGYYMGVWGHGYMLWYVCELADTASPENRVEIDRLAVQLLTELSSWQSKTGGWGHHPELVPTVHGYNEFSVITSLSLCSLLRAQERGYYVNPKVIEGAFKYLDSTITGKAGAPRYAADENVGAGNQREGAPRGALVMLPYALDRRTTPAVRRLLDYLRKCEDFTGGHASAALGMCHSALLFASIDEYNHFWKLHGKNILERQKEDGSFNALPPGERTNEERAGHLSDAFHTLTLALPDAPWKWRQKAMPDASYYSMRAILERARAYAEKTEETYPSIQELADIDPEMTPASQSRKATSLLRRALRESRENNDAQWLAEILDPYASCQVISKSSKSTELMIAVSPTFLKGLQAEAKIMLEGDDRVLRKTKITPKTTAMSAKAVSLRTDDVPSIDDVRIQIDWTWSGRTFTTTHLPLTAPEEG